MGDTELQVDLRLPRVMKLGGIPIGLPDTFLSKITAALAPVARAPHHETVDHHVFPLVIVDGASVSVPIPFLGTLTLCYASGNIVLVAPHLLAGYLFRGESARVSQSADGRLELRLPVHPGEVLPILRYQGATVELAVVE